YTGMPDPVVQTYTDRVDVRHEQLPDGDVRTVTTTPHGELVERTHETVDRTWRTVDFPVKTPADLKKLKWLVERTAPTFSLENFERGSRFIGHRGEPQFWVPKSPYQALCQIWMKLDDFVYALADAPREVEDVMEAIDKSYDRLYDELAASGRVRIVNFGENIHDHLLSPAYFERYLIPWYEKRAGQLRSAGIFTHVHIDGYFRSLLPYLAKLPFDGLEALTPLPQGDVSLEEIGEHIGNKVLLDGIPAVYFLPHYSLDRLAECVETIVELFHPRLVLGISDELPQGADESGIDKVRWVSDYCRRWRT
ncbi:MAG: uroporphyrinogen decarboxylase family protein, partial [Planctomycetota bacterium]